MSLNRRLAVILIAFVGVAAPTSPRAFAGVLANIGKGLGGGAAEGAVEKLEPALARTIADVDNRLTAQ